MHYVEAGPPDGDLIVLLHGFPEFWYSWRSQLTALAEAGYRAVAPDLRGYNLTSKPASGYDLPTLTNDVVALVRALGRDRTVVCGHDWGGAIAWSFGAFHPEMTRALVVMNAPHPRAFQRELRRWRQALRSWYMLFFQVPVLAELTMSFRNYRILDRMFRRADGSLVLSPEDLQVYKDAIARPGVLTSALNYYRQLARASARDGLRGGLFEWPVIQAPTLLVWGTEDIALGMETTYGTEEWVPDLRLGYLEGASHWVQQERPGEVNALVLDFLAELRRREGDPG
ncbi:MAG: alpha/beta fold hydrolase [Dehalococcoidia bacterium]|nr:alpha/beta fold hydrolase [Dehalococcoidia bacterium]